MADLDAERATQLLARAALAGASWGAAIGSAFLAWAAVADRAASELWLTPVAALVGAIVGSSVGAVNGVVLSAREEGTLRGDRGRRLTAFVTSGALLTFAGAVLTQGDAMKGVLFVALTGAIAGAALAPCVVHGRHPHKGDPA